MTDLSSIRAEVAALDDQALILEVVKAIGWTVQEGGHYAMKHDGTRFMLADPKVLGRCMLGSVLDLTSKSIQWARLHEVVSGAWENPFTVENFEEALRYMAGNTPGPDLCDALMIKPRQLCECIVMAQRMRG
jgi:hypothetical protein